MKSKKINLIPIFLLLLPLCVVILGPGCNDDPEPLDGSLHVNIYKTRNDYFNNVHLNLIGGEVKSKPSLHSLVDFDKDGKPHYRYRVKLHDGFILGTAESYNHTVFLSYTIEEYYTMENDPVNPSLPSIKELEEHIIDRDPFVEFYTDSNSPAFYSINDTTLINQMIDKNQLDIYFKRLK
jgi:hypothetical protein